MQGFNSWLCEQKNYKERSARDACSRLRRVYLILNKESVNNDTVEELEKNEEFKELSISVRSQLRKSVRLYLEYKGIK